MTSTMKRSQIVAGDVTLPLMPAGYRSFFKDIKARIRATQTRAALAASAELIRLYWDIGRDVVERQMTHGWGTTVIERLAHDIQQTFPGVQGFSKQNIWYMRKFYLAWADMAPILQRPVGELKEAKTFDLPQILAQLPWGQNITLWAKYPS